MAHFEDLSPCHYFGPREGLLSVGWLDRDHPFPKGRVTREFFEALAQLAANAWEPLTLAGRHPCELCAFTGGPAEVNVGALRVTVGSANLFIPAERSAYVAPSLILHYIDAHEYAPPAEFQLAVTACPPMRSMPYLMAVRRHGLHRLGQP